MLCLFCVSNFILSTIQNCSATEGADSRPASGPGTPSDEKAGQVGMGKYIFSLRIVLFGTCPFYPISDVSVGRQKKIASTSKQ